MLKSSPAVVHVSRVKPALILSTLDTSATSSSNSTISNGSNNGGNNNSSSSSSSSSSNSHNFTIMSAADTAVAHRTQQPMMASQRPKDRRPTQREDPTRAKMPPTVFFPLGYKDAAYQWWTSVTAPIAEQSVLSFMPFLKPATASSTELQQQQPQEQQQQQHSDSTTADPHGHRVWRTTSVQLSGKNRALNEFSVERVGEQVDDTLVMLHGYGAGLGFFYKNFEPLSRAEGWRLYALDMLGMGNSSRPPFRVQAKDQQGKIREAEDWFVDSLEEWRKIRKIERFTLLGHSLGGYLAVSYALKYPGRLNKLILASPVGIPEDPYAVNADMPEPAESTMNSEFTEDQESIVHHPRVSRTTRTPEDNNNFMNARSKRAAAGGKNKDKDGDTGTDTDTDTNPTGAPKRPINKWVSWLWDANVSPFSIVRLTGPLGPRFVSGWTSRRFSHLPPEESQALHTYSYSLFRQRGSGEYALPYILAPGAYARSPIINRIHEVGRQVIAAGSAPSSEGSPARETGIPVVMMYGDNDWMDVAGGFAAEERLKARAARALAQATTPEERRRENGSAKVVIVRNAGHHLYIDNPDEFNRVIADEMRMTREHGLRHRS